jgi:hypothetical protein
MSRCQPVGSTSAAHNRPVIRYVPHVSVLQTFLVFVVPVVGVYFLVSLAVVGTKKAKRRRYRVGEPWDFEPLWWTANPEGAHLPAAHARPVVGERGGARGSW